MTRRQRRPLTGARIETRIEQPERVGLAGRPLTGARIETASHVTSLVDRARRPLTGARIETSGQRSAAPAGHVAPSRGRGSKHGTSCQATMRLHVAPSRGRGSKHGSLPIAGRRCRVAPSRGRGSKHADAQTVIQTDRRPLTGARIETSRRRRFPCAGRTSPPHGGADRNTGSTRPRARTPPVAPSRGRGSKRLQTAMSSAVTPVAPSRGRGSKPGLPSSRLWRTSGRPLMGARPLKGAHARPRGRQSSTQSS